MRYYFYLGNSEEREELINKHKVDCPPVYQEKATHTYVTFRGKEVEVVRSVGRWIVLDSYDAALLRYLNYNPTLRIVQSMEDREWEPVTYTDEDSWSCFMVDQNNIVGFYTGSIEEDSLGRKYTSNSFVGIRPDYRGRGLCRELARFTYDNLIKQVGVGYIVTKVDSNIGAGASRSYMRAAKDLGLSTYGYCSDQGDEDENLLFGCYQALEESEDCDRGKNRFSLPSYLDNLVFSTYELDKVMVESSL